jgi:hypothetical protein
MATKLKVQYIVDEKGKKVGVLLDIKTYRKMIADLEELEDIVDAKEIHQAISNGEPTMSWDEHLKKTKKPVSQRK